MIAKIALDKQYIMCYTIIVGRVNDGSELSKEDKTMTLKDFIHKHKTQEAAARELGIPLLTLGRWIRGKNKPSQLALALLKSHGVTGDKK